MSHANDFDFGDDDVARSYDDVIVPVLFDPWARQILDEHGPWTGKHVLNLAAGTGIFARHLVRALGPEGRLIAVELAYACPIGRSLRDLPEEAQDDFRNRLLSRIDQICTDGVTTSPMTTHVLLAEKN